MVLRRHHVRGAWAHVPPLLQGRKAELCTRDRGSLQTPWTLESTCLPKWYVLDVLSAGYSERGRSCLDGTCGTAGRKRQSQASEAAVPKEAHLGHVTSPLWLSVLNLENLGIGLIER